MSSTCRERLPPKKHPLSTLHVNVLCQKVLKLGNHNYIQHVLWKIFTRINHMKNEFAKQTAMMGSLLPVTIELLIVSEGPEDRKLTGERQKTLEGWVTLTKLG